VLVEIEPITVVLDRLSDVGMAPVVVDEIEVEGDTRWRPVPLIEIPHEAPAGSPD
jgi:hypothetical protein